MTKNSLDERARALVWSPIHHAIEQQIQSGDKLLLIISPFIKQNALERLLSNGSLSDDAKVIVRWQPNDILHSAADLSIYPLLKDQGVSLYRHEDIHLKLYIFESNLAFHTSANLTGKGFGYGSPGNVEIGCFLQLQKADWIEIYSLIENSILVDDPIYEQFLEYEASNKSDIKELPKLDLQVPDKPFSINSLPATETPQALLTYYAQDSNAATDPELDRRYLHDLGLYAIPAGLSQEQLIANLHDAFVTQPFILGLVEFIKEQKSARFGAVNEWIHSNCSDVPLPYRCEIKENTNILYNWLAYFFDEIRWDVPGARSQVIYWEG